MKDNRLTILVVSYDGYSDLWNDFFSCKENNWNDCPFETVLANNEKSLKGFDVRVLNCGKDAQWSTRTRLALENINTKYVCVLLEDFFISEKVNNQDIYNAIDFMEQNEFNYYKLDTFSKITTSLYADQKHLRCIPSNLTYGVSLLAAIWDRKYFLSKIGKDDYNAWVFEIKRNKEADDSKDKDVIVGVYDERDILHICHMVVQGKYLPSAIKEMYKKKYEVNVSREIMCGKESFVYYVSKKMARFSRKYPFVKKLAMVFGFSSVSDKQTNAKSK
jgi:hypothetical protein